jgi:hypothetical protein
MQTSRQRPKPSKTQPERALCGIATSLPWGYPMCCPKEFHKERLTSPIKEAPYPYLKLYPHPSPMRVVIVTLSVWAVAAVLDPYPLPTIPQEEKEQLQALYVAANGDGWTDNQCWMDDLCDPCTWFGVTCRRFPEGPHVISVELSNNNLTGSLPDTLGWLTFLTRLDVSHNQLRPVPSRASCVPH